MFKTGDCIVFGTRGVCQVVQVGYLNLDGIPKDKLYYTLTPYYSHGSTVFTPVDNQKVIMRPILTKREAEKLLDEMKDIETLWIGSEKLRELRYKDALRTCDCREIVKIIKTIHLRKRSRIAAGKKITFIDEKYFKIAQDSLYGELAVALNMSRETVKRYVIEHVKNLELAAKRS